MKNLFSILVLFVCFAGKTMSQNIDAAPIADSLQGLNSTDVFPIDGLTANMVDKYANVVSGKSAIVSKSLRKSSDKALARMYAKELRISKRLSRIDSSLSKKMFADIKEKYRGAGEKITNKVRVYIPGLDSMKAVLGVMDLNKNQYTSCIGSNVKDAFDKINGLEETMQKSLRVQNFINERRQALSAQLSSLGFYNEIKKLQKQTYYFRQEFEEYKSMLNDEKKIEKKAIDILRKTTVFQNLLKKNSVLAGLFAGSGGPIDPTMLNGLIGLQARTQVNQVMQNRLSGTSGSPQQFVQSAVQSSQNTLSELEKRLSSLGGGKSGDFDIPDFKPSAQKEKSLLKKFELSTNIQSSKHNNLFPVSTDFGLSIGFKPLIKFIVGVGGSFRMGWGTGFKNIQITNQGFGLRSFIDFKVRETFYLSGGYERNYFSEAKHIEELKNKSGWKESALLGISKKYKVGKKKNGELKMLYDFFARTRLPVTSPFIFRVGLGFSK
jgi:hypothetical protein